MRTKSSSIMLFARHPAAGAPSNDLTAPLGERGLAGRRRFGFRWCALLALFATLAAPSAPLGASNRRAFVTSTSGDADLSLWYGAGGASGIAAGDNICRTLAHDAGLPNDGTYRAWLSTSTNDAYCHVQGLTGKRSTGCGGGLQPGAGPWFQSNGLTAFVGSLADLTGAWPEIYRAQIWDETFAQLAPNTYVWTGTSPQGENTPGIDCDGWTSSAADPKHGTIGWSATTVESWTDDAETTCDSDFPHLLCLEGGTGDSFEPFWSPASLVFVTSKVGLGNLSSWPQAGGATGIAAGDAICRKLAADAHLPAPESFVAWLSNSADDAATRVTSNGPFKRLDGLTIANGKVDLTDGSVHVSVHQDELGRYSPLTVVVYTGTLADGSASGVDCDDWTASGEGNARVGGSQFADDFWTNLGSFHCGNLGRLYCFSNVVTLAWDGFESGDFARWDVVVP